MNRLHVQLLLLLALIASALLLVKTAYETRRLYTALDNARTEQRKLEVEYKRLDAERQAQATHLRVDKTAREKLAMRTATPAVTVYVDDAAAASAPALAAPQAPTPTPAPAAPQPIRVAAGGAR